MLAFWLSLFYSTEFGIFIPIGFNIVYNILRQAFTSLTASAAPAPSELAAAGLDDAAPRGLPPPTAPSAAAADVRVFRFRESVFFPNSHRLTGAILAAVQTHHAPLHSGAYGSEAERTWSVVAAQRVARLRRAAGVDASTGAVLPPIGLVVLDFGRVAHVDATAVAHLATLVGEVRRYGGSEVEFRFVGVAEGVRARFERAGWPVVDAARRGEEAPAGLAGGEDGAEGATRLYGTVAEAVMAARRRASYGSDQEYPVEKADTVQTQKPEALLTETLLKEEV